jgi:putative inorganic carbon (hco3(-)) transporter
VTLQAASSLAAQKFLSLTLPPPPVHPLARRLVLLVVIIGLGTALAWLPLTWGAGLIAGLGVVTLVLLNPILSLYGLIPLIPFSSLVALEWGGFKVGAMELTLALGLSAWLLQLAAHLNPNLRPPAAAPLLWPFLIFLGAVSLSWLTTFSIGASLVETAKWIEMLALYLLVVALLPRRYLESVVLVVVLTGVAQAGLGLYQFIFKVGPEGFLLFGGQFLRAYGTFAQPNPYAGYLGLVLPLALSMAVWAFSRWRLEPSRWIWIARLTFYLASLGLMLAALFASQSRGAWLGFGLAVIVTLGLRSKKTTFITLVLAFLGAGLLLVGSFDWGLVNANAITQRFGDALQITSIGDISTIEVNDANFATIERLAHWQAAREMWRDHPWLGVGFGNYAAIYPAYAVGRWLDPLGHAHNYLLNIGAEAGLVGLTAYLIFWIFAFGVSYLALRRSQDFERAVAAGGLGILVYLQVHNFVDNLYVQGMYLHVAIILALISIIYLCPQVIPNKESQP